MEWSKGKGWQLKLIQYSVNQECFFLLGVCECKRECVREWNSCYNIYMVL